MMFIDKFDPAFPTIPENHGYKDAGGTGSGPGITVLDYFAIHGQAPGQQEVAAVTGWKVKGMNAAYDDPEAKHFNDLWATLTNEERFRINAIVRYQMAKAMVAIRNGR